MMKAELLDMTDYRLSGEGANGSSYDCVSNPLIMVKLYNTGYDTAAIGEELEVAGKVYDLGVPSPEPGVLVTDGERLGIRFRRIVGKRSFARAMADEPERIPVYAGEFARWCKYLHSREVPQGLFPDAKGQYEKLIAADRVYSDSQKDVMLSFLHSVPDSGTALHGDMHVGNVLTTLPAGAPVDAPHDVYFIDLGYFARGCNLFDLGMLQNICLISDEEFRFHDMHLTGAQTALLWEHFIPEYFGDGRSAADVNDLIHPYSALKLFLVEYNLGFMPPHYDRFIRDTFGF